MTAATASAGALRNVAISVATGQETASMAFAATDRRMQPRVCKIRAEIEVSGALTERIEGAKEGAKAEVIEAVAPTESSDGSTSNRRPRLDRPRSDFVDKKSLADVRLGSNP